MKRNRVGETYPRENTPRNATFPFVCTASPVVSVICLHGLCSSCNFKGNGLFRVASEETRRWCCSVLLSPEDRDRNGARAVRRIRYQVKYRMGWKLEFLRKYFYFNHRRWYLWIRSRKSSLFEKRNFYISFLSFSLFLCWLPVEKFNIVK